MTDYAGNSNKDKEKKEKPDETGKEEVRPKPALARVVTGEVRMPKKSMGQRVRTFIISWDLGSVGRYVVHEVMVPAFKDLLASTATQGVDRLLWRDGGRGRRGPGPGRRSTYTYYDAQTSNRGFRPDPRGPGGRSAPPIEQGPRRSSIDDALRVDFVIPSRDECETVLEQMINCIETYDKVSVGDLHELVGYPTNQIAWRWGWISLLGAAIIQAPGGYYLQLPAPGAFQD